MTGTLGTRRDIPGLRLAVCRNRLEFEAHLRSPEMAERAEFERAVGPGEPIEEGASWTVIGQCYVCRREVDFWADTAASWRVNGILIPNWREHATCSGCRLNSRLRASIHLFEVLLVPEPSSRIYLTEQVTAFYSLAASRYRNLVGSEFLGPEIAPGSLDANGIRHEDFQNLSFPDGSLDFILTFDVLEHVPDHQKVLKECRRVLVPGGKIFMTVPFHSSRDENVVRAGLSPDGDLVHILPPQYHGNPLSAEGSLVFNDYGWDLLEDARAAGFDPAVIHFWSDEYVYLGGGQLIFVFTAVRAEFDPR